MPVNNFIIYIFIVVFILFLFVALFYPLIIQKKLLELFALESDSCEWCCKSLNNVNNNNCRHNCIMGVVCNCCNKNREYE